MTVGWWFVYLGCVGFLTLLFHFWGKNRDTIQFLGILLAAAAAIGQLHSQAVEYRQSVRHRRVEAAFRYIKEWGEPPFTTQVLPVSDSALRSVRGKPVADVDAYLRGHTAENNAVLVVINKFEDAGIAVRSGFADDGTLCDYISEPAAAYFSALQPWIVYYRKAEGGPGAWENYQWVYEHWAKGCAPLDSPTR